MSTPQVSLKALQALIVQMYPGSRPVDRRGSDNGRDVRWDSPEGLVIFEIKSHTDRLSTSNKTKIKKLLDNASRYQPVRWVLVVPLDHSPAEETWFDNLDTAYPDIALEWRGARWLDVEFGHRPYLRRMLESEAYHLHQLAHEFGKEQAALTGGMADVIKRHGKLNAKANELLSPFWVTHTAITDNHIDIRYEERYPGAAELDPITPRMSFLFPPGDAEAAETERRLRDFDDYGGDVEIDGKYVTQFEIQTSESSRDLFNIFAEGTTESLRFTSTTIASDDLPIVQFVVTAPGGTPKYRLPLTMQPPTHGKRGIRVRGADATNTIGITLTVDDPAQGGGHRLGFTLKGIAGKFPYALRPAYEIITHLGEDDGLELHINEHELQFDKEALQAIPEMRLSARIVVALDQLQAHARNKFPIPDDLTYQDASDIIFAARLLAGEHVRTSKSVLQLTIRNDKLADYLASGAAKTFGNLVAEFTDYTLILGSHHIGLGTFNVIAPNMR